MQDINMILDKVHRYISITDYLTKAPHGGYVCPFCGSGSGKKGTGKKGIYNTKLSKPVLQIDKNTNEVIAEFPSAKEVHRQLGYSQGHISACCRMETKQSYGYIWRYK